MKRDPAARGGRGGYCFEQNGVFLRVLEALGFQVTPLSARVRWMLPEDAPPGPLSHMLLRVHTPDGPFLADVGFGGQSPTGPLRFVSGLEQATPHGIYRLMEASGVWELQMQLADRWAAMYRFNLEPRLPADYEVSNWFTSTHPDSRFTTGLMASRVLPQGRLNLLGVDLTIHSPDGPPQARRIGSAAELHQLLTQDFGLRIDATDAERVFEKIAGRTETP